MRFALAWWSLGIVAASRDECSHGGPLGASGGLGGPRGFLRPSADASVGDVCVARHNAATWWCPADCNTRLRAPYCTSLNSSKTACRTRLRQKCGQDGLSLEQHDSNNHGDVCRKADGDFECPPDCMPTKNGAPYCYSLSKSLRRRACVSKLRPPPSAVSDWACDYPGRGNAPCSAVATLYTLQAGGGERYLLMMASALQAMGHYVDVIVLDTSDCLEEACAQAAADKLAVKLDWSKVRIRVATASMLRAQHGEPPLYSIFAFMANSKVPEVPSLGHHALFMCQFPFDLNEPVRKASAAFLSTYDAVLLNSRFTLEWYERSLRWVLPRLARYGWPAPTRTVLYPPVPHPVPQLAPRSNERYRPPSVILIGRFFDARQGKRQLEAIEAFVDLHRRSPHGNKPQLYLVGSKLAGFESYFNRVAARVSEVKGAHLLPDLSRDKLSALLRNVSVVWSLTGLKSKDAVADPADEEHFGIAVSEAMGRGCIPVLLRKGALAEHVVHGHSGFLGDSITDIVRATLRVHQLSWPEAGRMRVAAATRAFRFSDDAFLRRFTGLFASQGRAYELWNCGLMRHVRARPSRIDVAQTKVARYEAVIVDTRSDLLLPLIIRHTAAMLPCDWGMHVVHGASNGDFLRDALVDVRHVRYSAISADKLDDSSYNALLKSGAFWQMEAVFEKVLIFQLDAVVLQRKRSVEAFLKFDFIGAPWARNNDVYVGLNEQRVAIPTLPRTARVGNGGLSLRSPRAMLAVLNKHASTSENSEQEDVFFVRHLSSMGYAVAGEQAALDFAIEVPISELTFHFGQGEMYGKNAPWGLHQSWFYTLENPKKRRHGATYSPPDQAGTGVALLRKLVLEPPQDFGRNCNDG